MTGQDGHRDVPTLRAEITRTRAELGETVQALAARADVKARLRDSAAQTGQRARAVAANARFSVRGAGAATLRDPARWAAVAASAVAVLVVVLVVRGRRG